MAHDVTDKIAKLLALAEASTNPEEAEAFTEKAETLMLQYGIEQAQVAARRPGDKKEEILIEHIRFDNPFYQPLGMLGSCVAPAFSIKGYRSEAGNKKVHIWLVGHKTDVEQAATLVRSLVIQAEYAANYWWKTEGDKSLSSWNAFVQKRQFIYAFGSGVRERLSEVRNRVVNESGPGTELVLLDRTKLVEGWISANMQFGKGKGSAIRAGDRAAAVAGHAAGRDAVGQKAVR